MRLAPARRTILSCVVFVGLAAGAAPPQAEGAIEIVEMIFPNPAGAYCEIEPLDINDQNQVTGRMVDQSGRRVARAFLWQDNQFINLGNGLTYVGDRDHGSRGLAINNRGEVVGGAENLQDLTRSMLWTSYAGMNDINIPYPSSLARTINDAGFIGGSMTVNDGTLPGEVYQNHGYIWHNGAVFEVPTHGGRYSNIEDINNAGQAVGYSTTDPSGYLAILVENSTVTQLQRFPGSEGYSFAEAINDDGVIVGSCDWGDDENEHAAMWIDKDLPPINLGTLGGDASEAIDINNRGQIIGTSTREFGSFPDDYPFVWQNGHMYDLDMVVPDGWDEMSVTAINNSGWILGIGHFYGQGKWVLIKFDGFVRVPTGNADLTYSPTGFTDGAYGTAGMGQDAIALGATVDVSNPEFGPGGFYTLCMDYDPADLLELGVDEGTIGLYVFEGATWGLAGRNTNLDDTTGQFVLGPPTDAKGDWGVDLNCHYVWANLDHASLYGMAGTPEPATLALLSLGAAALLCKRRRSA
jgi:probable HAF family extracellular repeat protein